MSTLCETIGFQYYSNRNLAFLCNNNVLDGLGSEKYRCRVNAL